MNKTIFIFCIVICCFFACNSNKQKQVLSINEMKGVVADIMKVDEYVVNIENKDSAKLLKDKLHFYYEVVYKSHDITKEQFTNSYKYYEKKPALLKVLFDSVAVTMQRKPKTYGGVLIPKT